MEKLLSKQNRGDVLTFLLKSQSTHRKALREDACPHWALGRMSEGPKNRSGPGGGGPGPGPGGPGPGPGGQGSGGSGGHSEPPDSPSGGGKDEGGSSGVALKKQIGLVSACGIIVGKSMHGPFPPHELYCYRLMSPSRSDSHLFLLD